MNNAFLVKTAPLLPWPLLAGLFAAALLLLAFGILRRARGVVLRGLVFATLLAALLNPSLIEEKRVPRRDVAVIVVDRSPSQSIGRRRAVTKKALESLVGRLSREKGLAVRVVQAGTDALAAAARGTRLFHALDRAVSDIPRRRLAGVVMITDGEVSDVPKGDEAALRRAVGAPLYVLLSGRPQEKDRRLIVVRAPRFGIVGRKIAVVVRVEDEGENREKTRGREVNLTWRKDGGPRHRLLIPLGRDIPLDFAIDHGGANVIELRVAPGPHVLTPLNKEAVVAVNGVRDRLKVLLVSGKPTRDERVWRDILKSDPSVDLVHFTILRPPEKQDATPIRELALIAFPTRELFDEKLKDFDLVIFENYDGENVIPYDYLANVVQYVRSGGAFLEVAGPPLPETAIFDANPLDRILPARLTGSFEVVGFRPRLTALGRRHPVTAGLPGAGPPGGTPRWGRWFREEAAEVRRGVVLMTGAQKRPLLVLDRVGKGRVAELLSDAMWLWARGFEGGGPQAELLRRLVYWLMKEPALAANALRARVERDRLVVTRQSLRPDHRPVSVVLPDGSKKTLVLSPQKDGRSSGTLPIDEIGLYHVSDGTRTAVAAAGPLNSIEFADVRTTAKKLAPVVAATGGRVFWVASGKIPELRRVPRGERMNGKDWMGFRENGQYRVTGFREIPLLPGIAALFLILGSLLAAWRREGS